MIAPPVGVLTRPWALALWWQALMTRWERRVNAELIVLDERLAVWDARFAEAEEDLRALLDR
jgi:predicted phosphohydrolase